MARVPPHFYLSHRIVEGYFFYHEWERECPARRVLATEGWAKVEGTGGHPECDICRRLSEMVDGVKTECDFRIPGGTRGVKDRLCIC